MLFWFGVWFWAGYVLFGLRQFAECGLCLDETVLGLGLSLSLFGGWFWWFDFALFVLFV